MEREIKFKFIILNQDTKETRSVFYTLDEVLRSKQFLDLGVMWTIIRKFQFTGIYDRGGHEIYEGDIVKHTIRKPYDCISEVKFVDGAFKLAEFASDLHFSNTAYRQSGSEYGPDEGVEIIGNIYDNPELLK